MGNIEDKPLCYPFLYPLMKSRRPLLEKLSIKYILDRHRPEEIFARYWDISEHEITECLHTGKFMCAPYRDDNRPSLGFYTKDGKVYARDWQGYFWGDCFDCVAFVTRRGKEGKEFGKVLEQIAYDFGLHRFSKESDRKYKLNFISQRKPRGKLEIQVGVRPWNRNDAAYWRGKYHFNKKLLDEFYVYPVDCAFINGLLRYTYDRNNPCYAYYFGKDNNGIENWKLYFPYADPKKRQQKFMQNVSCIEGALHIHEAKIGIMTKSYKDVIGVTMVARMNHLSILALAPPSESTIINEHQYNAIMRYVPILYTLSDYDRTGIKFAGKMRRAYNTIPLFFFKGLFGKPNFNAKDYTDNLERYGLNNISKLTKRFYNDGHVALLKHLTNGIR